MQKYARVMLHVPIMCGVVLSGLTALATPAQAAVRSCSASTPLSQLPTLRYGDTGSCVKGHLQPLLSRVGYFYYKPGYTSKFASVTLAGVKGVQAKAGLRATGVVDRSTWSLLRAPTATKLRLPTTCRTGIVVCVSKVHRKVWLAKKGVIVTAGDARFGSSKTPTRNGNWLITAKRKEHISSLFGSYMPDAVFFSGGQAVHYSPDFAARGYAGASKGCVNMRERPKTTIIFNAVKPGRDRVVVY